MRYREISSATRKSGYAPLSVPPIFQPQLRHCQKSKQIMSKGGFNLRKMNLNSHKLKRAIEEDEASNDQIESK